MTSGVGYYDPDASMLFYGEAEVGNQAIALPNIGNSCYMASVVQMAASIAGFKKLLANDLNVELLRKRKCSEATPIDDSHEVSDQPSRLAPFEAQSNRGIDDVGGGRFCQSCGNHSIDCSQQMPQVCSSLSRDPLTWQNLFDVYARLCYEDVEYAASAIHTSNGLAVRKLMKSCCQTCVPASLLRTLLRDPAVDVIFHTHRASGIATLASQR